MALTLANRVRETTTTTGTGTVTLAGAVTGYQAFSVIGNANTTYYTISGQGTSEFEVGIGTYTLSGTTLSRDTVLASSNGGSLVNFSAGTKDAFVTYPSNKAVYLDASGNASALGTPASGTVTNLTGTASININGTVGATTATTGAFTTLSATGATTLSSTLGVTGATTILKNGGTGATAGLLLNGGGTATTFNIDFGSATANRLYMRQNYTDNTGDVKFQYSSDGTMASPIDVLAVKWGGGIAVTGTLSATTGAAVGGATAGAGGLAFPASAVAVANANTLDDYEEGTWTPSLGGNTTYGTQVGKYTKIGRLVSAKFSLSITTLGTGSTSTISGLPFTVGSMSDLQPGTVAYFQNLAASVTHIGLYADDSSTTLGFATTGGNGSTASALSAIFGNSARIQGEITYFT